MADRKTFSIRLALHDAETVKQALIQLGADGQAALRRIEGATGPTSRGLLAVNAVSREGQFLMQGYAGRLGLVGTGMAALGPGGLAAAAGIAAVGVSLHAALERAKEGMEFADALQNTTKGLKISVEAFQEYAAAAQDAGVKAEEFKAGLARFLNVMQQARDGDAEAAAIVRRLNLQLTDTAGSLRPLEALYRDTFEAASKFSDQSERVRVFTQLFGKGIGSDLAGAAADGAAGLDAAAAAARELGIVLDRDAVRRGAEAANAFDRLTRAMDVQLKGAFLDLAPVLVESAGLMRKIVLGAIDLVNRFRDVESISLDGMRRRLASVTEELERFEKQRAALAARPGLGLFDQGSSQALDGTIAKKRKEAADLIARIATLEAGTVPDAPKKTGDLGIGFDRVAVGRRVEGLLAEVAARRQLADATGLGDRATRAANLSTSEENELRKLNLGDTEEQTRRLADLMNITVEEARAVNLSNLSKKEARDLLGALIALEQRHATAIGVRARAEATNIRFDPEFAAARRIETLREEEATGLLTAEAIERAYYEMEQSRLQGSRDAGDGMVRAMRATQREATDAAANVERAWRAGATGVEDALTTVAVNGKASLDDLVNIARQVYSEVVRLLAVKPLVGALTNALGDAFGINLSGGRGGGGAGFGGGASSFAVNAPTGTLHEGGIVGGAARLRMADPRLFANAARYHEGGLPGLRPGEVPIIAKKGEGVFTPEQMRALGGAGSAPILVTVVNQTGVAAQPKVQDSGGGQNGFDRRELKILLTPIVNDIIGGGAADTSMGRRYGATPRPVRRG